MWSVVGNCCTEYIYTFALHVTVGEAWTGNALPLSGNTILTNAIFLRFVLRRRASVSPHVLRTRYTTCALTRGVRAYEPGINNSVTENSQEPT